MEESDLLTARQHWSLIQELRKLSTFVLAGGRGERLLPLTRDRAKPAVVFGGIYRIIDFTLSNCVNSGIRRVSVLTQYKSISLNRHLRLGWSLFPSELDEFIDVLPAQQRYGEFWYRGTADAVYQNIYSIRQQSPNNVLILAGDHIYKMDYSRMLLYHVEHDADVTVGVVEMPRETGCHFGVLQVDTENSILDFQEKPEKPECIPGKPDSIYASMGIYIFRTRVLLEELVPEVEDYGHFDFGLHILPRMLGRRRMLAYSFIDENRREQHYWRDIGTLDAYYESNLDLVDVHPQFNLYDDHWPIRTHQRQFPPAKNILDEVGEGARRGHALNSVISGGCIISGGLVRRSILSPEVRIHSYSSVEDSVLMDGVSVGRHVRMRRAIIDKRCRILPQSVIGFDPDEDREKFDVTEGGVVVIPKGSVVGPDGIQPPE